MNRETSVYLDLVRFLAALAVFFSHIGTQSYSGGFLWQALRLSAPAVVVFFVLSGFVIGYVTARRESSGRDYVVARSARLYSVIIPTLFLTACLDWTGSRINPTAYGNVVQLIGAGAWYIPASLVFIHMCWGGGARIFAGSDGAYWSLGYEVIYYAIFGVAYYCRAMTRIVGCVLISFIAGPHIIGLFPIWLIGWAAFHCCRYRLINRRAGWIAFIASIGGMIVYVTFSRTSADLADHGILEIAQDYLLAITFSINLVGFYTISDCFVSVIRVAGRPIRWLAGATFTLYLLHVPILLFLKATSPWPQSSWQYRTVLIGAPLCAIFLVAQITERRKDIWRGAFDWIARQISNRISRFERNS